MSSFTALGYFRESLLEAGYRHAAETEDGWHLLKDSRTFTYEVWMEYPGYAGYALTYKGTDLAFVRDASSSDLQDLFDFEETDDEWEA